MKKASGLEVFLRAVLRYYPVVVKTLQQIASIVYSFINTFVSAFGALAVLILVTIVEHHRISAGVRSFETSEEYVALAAAAVIASLFFIEARISVIDWEAKNSGSYIEPKSTVFSMRIFWENWNYFWGIDTKLKLKDELGEEIEISEEWQPRQVTPSNSLRGLRNLIIGATMFLVIFGSLQTQIRAISSGENPSVWYEGLLTIVTSSNTETFMTMVSATLLTLVTVIVAARTTNIAVYYAMESLEELKKERERITNEDTVQENESIYLVKDILSHISAPYSKFKDIIPCIDPNNDKIDIKKHRFYDSKSKVWINDGKEYASPASLRIAVTRICEERRGA